jgi:hypothetical protein
MKRILTLTALMTTMATGAAYAAVPGELAPATQDAPMAYQGSWAMFVDGRFAGPLAGVEGCDRSADVVAQMTPAGLEKHPGGVNRPDCTVALSMNMAKETGDWINAAIGSRSQSHDVQLARTDVKGGPAISLRSALITEVDFPKLDAASKDPGYLRVSFDADMLQLTKTAPATPGNLTLIPFGAGPIDVQADGAAIASAQVGELKIKIPTSSSTGSAREYVRQEPAEVGDVALRIPESAVAQVEPWWSASFAGTPQERKLTIAYADAGKRRMTLTLNNTAPYKADIAPRTDGNRGVSLYAEMASIDLR